MKDKNSSTSIDRRTVLRSASVSALALGGLGHTVAAQGTATGKSLKFTEVRLSHQLTLHEPQYHYPTLTVDEFSTTHLVGKNQSKLYFNEAKNREIDTLNQDAVVASSEYSSLPTKLGGTPQSTITTSLYGSYRVNSALAIKDGEYTQPEISVADRASDLMIASEGQDATVPIGSEQVLTLPDREVTVEVFEYADEKPPERDDHRPAAPLRNYRDVQVTITPEIHARNHGELDVVTVNTPSPIPHPPEPQN